MNISQILDKNGPGTRASYYSGRGATTSDLTHKHLSNIHRDLKEYQGEEAAKAFVDMVEDMPNMNATDFINNCFRLEFGGYKWEKKTAKNNGHDIPKVNGEYDMELGALTLLSSMFNSGDATDIIKGPFLRSVGRNHGGRIIHRYGEKWIEYRDEYGMVYQRPYRGR